MIKTPDLDPFDSNKQLNVCNSFKCKCLIFLDVILTYTRDFLENVVKEGYLINVLMVLKVIIGIF